MLGRFFYIINNELGELYTSDSTIKLLKKYFDTKNDTKDKKQLQFRFKTQKAIKSYKI